MCLVLLKEGSCLSCISERRKDLQIDGKNLVRLVIYRQSKKENQVI